MSLLPGIFAGMYVPVSGLAAAALFSAIIAGLIYGGWKLHNNFTDKLGAPTATAALVLVTASVSFAIALALPSCPGLTVNGQMDTVARCTVYEAADWSLAVAMLVVLVATITFMAKSLKKSTVLIYNAAKVFPQIIREAKEEQNKAKADQGAQK